MLIHGGVTDEDEILSDCYLYTFQFQKWSAVVIDQNCICPKVSNHTMALVVPSKQKYDSKMNIYKPNEVRIIRKANDSRVIYKLIYLTSL